MAAIGTVVRRSVTLGGGLRPLEVGQGHVKAFMVASKVNRISSVRWPSSGGLLQSWVHHVYHTWHGICTMTVIGLRWLLTSVKPASIPWPSLAWDVRLRLSVLLLRPFGCWFQGSSHVPCASWSPVFTMNLVNPKLAPRSTLQFEVSLHPCFTITPSDVGLIPPPLDVEFVGLLHSHWLIGCWVVFEAKVWVASRWKPTWRYVFSHCLDELWLVKTFWLEKQQKSIWNKLQFHQRLCVQQWNTWNSKHIFDIQHPVGIEYCLMIYANRTWPYVQFPASTVKYCANNRSFQYPGMANLLRRTLASLA